MKHSYTKQTIAGIFVLIGIVCIGYLTIKLGKMELIGDEGYTLRASFVSVAGLRVGANVEIAGVNVGRVTNISLDTNKHARAVVKMQIKKDVPLTDDVIASVRTSGLIGDKYIMLSPGGSPDILKDGDEITETEPSVDIESLISKYAFGKV